MSRKRKHTSPPSPEIAALKARIEAMSDEEIRALWQRHMRVRETLGLKIGDELSKDAFFASMMTLLSEPQEGGGR